MWAQEVHEVFAFEVTSCGGRHEMVLSLGADFGNLRLAASPDLNTAILAKMTTAGTRILLLRSLLQSRRYWPGTELLLAWRSRRGRSGETSTASDLDYPVEARRGAEGGYQFAAGAVLPPLLLDSEEADSHRRRAAFRDPGGFCRGHRGVLTSGAEQGDSGHAHFASAPNRCTRRHDRFPAWQQSAASVDAGVLGSLAQACRDGDRLEFDYTDSGGQRVPVKWILTGWS